MDKRERERERMKENEKRKRKEEKGRKKQAQITRRIIIFKHKFQRHKLWKQGKNVEARKKCGSKEKSMEAKDGMHKMNSVMKQTKSLC